MNVPNNAARQTVTIQIDGKPVTVMAGSSVAAALAAQTSPTRGLSRTSVSGQIRAPVCGLGICHECRVLVNGHRQLACQTTCQDGSQIETGLATPIGQQP